MAKTKATTLTSTPQNIVVQSPCNSVLVKEDETVANWPATNLVIVKGGGDPDTISKGKSYQFLAPQHCQFAVGTILGTIATDIGTTSGIQDEQ